MHLFFVLMTLAAVFKSQVTWNVPPDIYLCVAACSHIYIFATCLFYSFQATTLPVKLALLAFAGCFWMDDGFRAHGHYYSPICCYHSTFLQNWSASIQAQFCRHFPQAIKPYWASTCTTSWEYSKLLSYQLTCIYYYCYYLLATTQQLQIMWATFIQHRSLFHYAIMNSAGTMSLPKSPNSRYKSIWYSGHRWALSPLCVLLL